MKEPEAQVEVNSRVFVLGHEATRSLAAAGVVHQCLQCDRSGSAYHLDPDHSVRELREAGARDWVPPGDPRDLPHRRIPTLFVHHLG